MVRYGKPLLAIVLLLGVAQIVLAGEPLKTGPQRDTLLYVRTDPPGAKVFLNGKELGRSDGLFRVEPGKGSVLIELEGRQPDERQLVVRANGITRFEVELKPNASAASASTDLERRSAPAVLSPAAKKVKFAIGPKAIAEGDQIVIEEVLSERGTLENGDVVSVKGAYTLTSHTAAALAFYVTSTERNSAWAPSPRCPVRAGTARFQMTRLVTPGYLHLAFCDERDKHCFGSIYFGTESQMEAISSWNVAKWISQQSPPKNDTPRPASSPPSAAGGATVK